MKNIMVVDGVWHNDVTSMFVNRGHKTVTKVDEADLICFIGGEDVQPSLYGQHEHESTHTNPARDEMEEKVFHYCINEGIPMVGICRGAQFLNVMNGGKLYQDVDNHATGNTHLAFSYFSDEPIKVTSTHHQMMIPNREDAIMLIKAKEATRYTSMSGVENSKFCYHTMPNLKSKGEDVEAILYPGSRSLCFQPHPEIPNAYDTRLVFFKFLKDYFDV